VARTSAALALAALTLAAAPVRAGGFGRPNLNGASAVGMGGAFAAVADDPTAIYHNPAGISLLAPTTALIDLGVVVPQRAYVPAGCSVTAPALPACGAGTPTRRTESEMTTALLAPTIAFSSRFAGKGGEDASRLGVGLGLFYTFGNSVQFSDKLSAVDRPGVRRFSVSLLEVVPAVAYQASDMLAVGAGLRVGIASFELNAPRLLSLPALDSGGQSYSEMSASGDGVSVGGTLGVTLRPRPWLTAAVVYRTPLKVGASGNLHIGYVGETAALDQPITVDLPFPQQISWGVAVSATPNLKIATQVDWTNWSSFSQLDLSGMPAGTAVYLALQDTWTAHLGAVYRVGPRLALRAGYSFDTAAVPDVTADRWLADAPAHTVAIGGGYAVTSRIRVDAAFEALFAAERTVAPSAATTPTLLQNPAPGAYRSGAYQGLVAAQYQY
jgi:long-chain fatty acid transport protein